jgi:hypothetical protein
MNAFNHPSPMQHIVNEGVTNCKNYKTLLKRVPSQVGTGPKSGPLFEAPSILPALKSNGFALLPGFTRWFELLSPINNQEAWRAFSDKRVSEIIRTHPHQQQRFFLNDSIKLDDTPQLSVNFEVKKEKSHLTILEGAEAISECPLIPDSVKSYLRIGNEFIESFRGVLTDSLPEPPLPTILKMRVFEYHASDLLAGIRPFSQNNEAMKPHVDGSICTLIIAASDGLLRYQSQGQWYPAVREDKRPFALVIPGVVASHSYGVSPTPHMVLASSEPRVSVTIFFTPALPPNREAAEQRIARWRY